MRTDCFVTKLERVRLEYRLPPVKEKKSGLKKVAKESRNKDLGLIFEHELDLVSSLSRANPGKVSLNLNGCGERPKRDASVKYTIYTFWKRTPSGRTSTLRSAKNVSAPMY